MTNANKTVDEARAYLLLVIDSYDNCCDFYRSYAPDKRTVARTRKDGSTWHSESDGYPVVLAEAIDDLIEAVRTE